MHQIRSIVGYSRVARYAAHMFPWIIFALVAVPLVVVGFVATRRKTVAGEHPASEDANEKALTEQEFAEAEAYEAKWREKDEERYHEERLP
jgi:cytochrome c oxidase assembly factor CtaG